MFLIHIQAKIGLKGNFPENQAEMMPMPSTLNMGYFCSKSRQKWCLWWTPPTNRSQYALHGMSPLPIQAETMPTWSSSHKPMPSMLSAGCFFYISRLKCCLQDVNPPTNAQYALYRKFLLYIQAEMLPTGISPTKSCPVLSQQDVSLKHPVSNGAYGELSQTHAH